MNLHDPLSKDVYDRLVDRLHHHMVNSLFHFEIVDLQGLYCAMRLPYQEKLTNGVRSKGTLHGGIVSTLADTAGAFALATCFDGRMSFATVDLHITFMARAQADIIAHARVIRVGSRINVVEVDLICQKKTVAKALINFILTSTQVPS